MPFVFDRLYRRLGRLYFAVYGVFNCVSAFIICLGTVGLFKLYEDPGTPDFWITLAFAEAVTLLTVIWVVAKGLVASRPLVGWVGGRRDEESSLVAWRAGVTFPREFVAGVGWKPFALVAIPVSVFVTIYQDLPGVQRGDHLRRHARRGRVRGGAALLRQRAVPPAGARAHPATTCPTTSRRPRAASRCGGSCSARCR